MAREFRSYRVEAIILRHTDWGEADRILTMFTRQEGKIRAIAKGVRKIRSRRAGHLEPFTQVNLQLARSRDMPIVTQAETIHAHIPLREDLVSIGFASYIVELIDKFTFEGEENRSLFTLLANVLRRFAKADRDPLLALRYYEIRLLDLAGFRPKLFQCARCGEEVLKQDQFFSAQDGGVLCPECAKDNPGSHPISMEALRYLRHFQRSSYQQAARAHPSLRIHTEMERILGYYITYVLEKELNSPKFMRNVRRMVK
jgi:DNA repair protein RecO (recombination protein O)